eukprot:38095-Eustigmatos_ZCMA.PRE.1
MLLAVPCVFITKPDTHTRWGHTADTSDDAVHGIIISSWCSLSSADVVLRRCDLPKTNLQTCKE